MKLGLASYICNKLPSIQRKTVCLKIIDVPSRSTLTFSRPNLKILKKSDEEENIPATIVATIAALESPLLEFTIAVKSPTVAGVLKEQTRVLGYSWMPWESLTDE